MDLTTIFVAAMLALGGLAVDAYRNPKSLIVTVVPSGPATMPSLDRAFISTVMQTELDRMAKVHSLIARPSIHPSDVKTSVEAIAEAVGGSNFFAAMSGLVRETPNTLKIGVFVDNDAPAVLITGALRRGTKSEFVFDEIMRQDPGETIVGLIKRSTIDGAARIDPYLAMLHLLRQNHLTGDDRYEKQAMHISAEAQAQMPKGHSVLLARLANLEGLFSLDRGDIAAARASFRKGLVLLPPGFDTTRVVLNLNLAFVEIAESAASSAAERIAGLVAPNGLLSETTSLDIVTPEGNTLVLGDDEVRFLRSTAYMLGGFAALANQDVGGAERMAHQALEISPTRLSAISLLADIAGRRGDSATAGRLRESIPDLQFIAEPYLETANAYATLSLATDTVEVVQSQYFYR